MTGISPRSHDLFRELRRRFRMIAAYPEPLQWTMQVKEVLLGGEQRVAGGWVAGANSPSWLRDQGIPSWVTCIGRGIASDQG
jgi:hypothetical protein